MIGLGEQPPANIRGRPGKSEQSGTHTDADDWLARTDSHDIRQSQIGHEDAVAIIVGIGAISAGAPIGIRKPIIGIIEATFIQDGANLPVA